MSDSFFKLTPDNSPIPMKRRDVMVLPNELQEIPPFFYEMIFNYEKQHFDAPRFILVGRNEVQILKRLDAPHVVNVFTADEHNMWVQGIQVIEVKRESFLELVG
jgi:hypothetical protein